MSSILKEDQYFNNEADFCRTESAAAKAQLERVFLENRISYFVKFEEKGFLERIFGGKEKNSYTVRINNRDIALATKLVRNISGVEIIGREPEPDWSPKAKLLRMQEQEMEQDDYEEL
ncbi:MAG: hypothetical protein Q4C60_03695 [Eubacteriales bacterium]|nr:hypothetical protein [Eubacteriales bacterium]